MVGQFQKPLTLHRTGEGTLGRTKQDALQQGIRDRGTVLGDKRSIPARAGVMDRLRKDVFSSPQSMTGRSQEATTEI